MEIRILEDKCNKCMLCVKECVLGVIRKIDDAPLVTNPELCNRCSHCLAICKQNAIENDFLDKEVIRKVKKDLLNSEIYKEIVLTRRSIRNYKNKPVSSNVIEDILDVARYSPTASNLQNVEYIIVSDKELLNKVSNRLFGYGRKVYKFSKSLPGKTILWPVKKTESAKQVASYMDGMEYFVEQSKKGKDYIFHNAPVLILILAPNKKEFSCDNCNIAATNITNYSHSLGLGTCYIGFLTIAMRFDPALRKWLKIPKGMRAYASLVLGYPKFSHPQITSRKKPKIINDNWSQGEGISHKNDELDFNY